MENSELTETKKRQYRWRPKLRACSSVSLTSRKLFKMNLSWHAKQSIQHSIVMFYGNCMKMCEDFNPKFGAKRTGCYITTMHCFSSGNFLPQNNIAVIPHPPHYLICSLQLFSVSSIEDTAVLTQVRWSRKNHQNQNTLTEHDVQDVFKKIAEVLGIVDTRGRGLLWGWWWPVGPKFFSKQKAAPVWEILDRNGTMYMWT
jgi:hypothetical protein